MRAWNAFDRFISWYAIGDKNEIVTANGEPAKLERGMNDTRITTHTATSKAAPMVVQGLDFTPVTHHLHALSQKAPSCNSSRVRINLVSQGAATVPKDLQYPESNEDAYAWDADTQRAAVFDGATESFAAKRWVSLVRNQWLSGNPRWLHLAREEYDRDIDRLNLTWAQLEAAERGSYTTLVSIEASSNGFIVTAIGDSCVFLLEGVSIIACDPYVSLGEFFASPHALSTRGQDNHVEPGNAVDLSADQFLISADVIDGRQLLLASDALAQWLMVPEPQERVSNLMNALKNDDLETLVIAERAAGRLRTDDTTALLLASGNQS